MASKKHKKATHGSTSSKSHALTTEVRRLSNHPSIVIWDGCNECTATWACNVRVRLLNELRKWRDGHRSEPFEWIEFTSNIFAGLCSDFFLRQEIPSADLWSRLRWAPKPRSMLPSWWQWWQKKTPHARSGPHVLPSGGQQDLGLGHRQKMSEICILFLSILRCWEWLPVFAVRLCVDSWNVYFKEQTW